MKAENAEKLLSEAEQTVRKIQSFKLSDPILLTYLARYLIVYLCGIYEEAIEEILRQKFSRVRSKYISAFLSNNVSQSFRNPSFDNVCALLKKFNTNWERRIKKIPEENKDAITSIVNIKNDLAHRGAATVTLNDALQYFSKSRVIIEKIDEIIL